MIGEAPTPYSQGDALLHINPDTDFIDDDHTGDMEFDDPELNRIINAGDTAQKSFDTIPETVPPEAYEAIFYDNIFEPCHEPEDGDSPELVAVDDTLSAEQKAELLLEAEASRMRSFRRDITERLRSLSINENAIDTVTLCATELITNAKRYAWGGDIDIAFTRTGDILVQVTGALAHPPELPAAYQKNDEVAEDDPFSESLEGLEELMNIGCIDVEPSATALEGLEAITANRKEEHGRGLNIVKAHSKTVGRWRETDEAAQSEDKPWSMWFTVSGGRKDFAQAH